MHPHDTPPDDGAGDFDDADRRIALAFGQQPSPAVPADFASRVVARIVRARIARRRVRLCVAGVAIAGAMVFIAWSIWPPHVGRRPGSQSPVVVNVVENAGQEALLAQWDKLLDEAAALPPVVVDLNILETQRAWASTLQDIQRR